MICTVKYVEKSDFYCTFFLRCPGLKNVIKDIKNVTVKHLLFLQILSSKMDISVIYTGPSVPEKIKAIQILLF